MPWIKVEHLASHILGRMASRISADWQRIYGYPIYFLETCRYVLEMLGQVYGHDAETRERSLTPDERLSFIKSTAAR